MDEIKKAAFSFGDFKITSFSFDNSLLNSEDGLGIKFQPTGVFNIKEGNYELKFEFEAFNEKIKSKKTTTVIRANLTANFKFINTPNKESIPPYFYKNAIAIIFPYLRAFISTLTLNANLNPLVLPLYNLSALEKPLIEGTTVI